MSDVDDDRLLAELGEAVRASAAVPARFLEAGRAAFAWRTVDAELAALVHDSAAALSSGAVAAGVRAEPASLRALTFVAGELTIELELTDDGLLGQLVPPRPGQAELHSRTGPPRTVEVDDVGWFVLRPRPSGLVRLRIHPTDAPPVITPWITL